MTDTAELLTAAAAELRGLDRSATPGMWSPLHQGDERVAIFAGPRDEAGYLTGSVLEIGDCEDCGRPAVADLELMCRLRPVAAPLAVLFDKLAWMVGLDPDLVYRVGVGEAVAVARAVVGSKTPV